MQTYVAVLIIICIAAVLVLLFYLVTRYFNYRLKKSLHDQNQVYSMVDGLEVRKDKEIQEVQSENLAEEICQNLQLKREDTKKQFIQLAHLFDSNQLQESLASSGANIYGRSRLERRQKAKLQSIPLVQESFRQSTSNKSFSVQKLESFRSINTTASKDSLQSNPQKQNIETSHKYIDKLVAFTNEGISIVTVEVTEIQRERTGSEIKQKKKIDKKFISVNDEQFYDTLEAYGFDFEIKSAYKFQKTLKIINMKVGRPYDVRELKPKESKQEIQMEEFYKLKNILQMQ